MNRTNAVSRIAIAALMAGSFAGVARAEEAPAQQPEHAASQASHSSGWKGSWLVRLRATAIITSSGVKSARVDNVPAATAGALGLSGTTLPLPNDSLSISNRVLPEIDLSYFVTDHIALETICCLTKHTIKAVGPLGDVLTGVGQNGPVIAKSYALPFTVLLQYHLEPIPGFKPYVGAGPTYAVFFGDKTGPGLAPFARNLHIKDTLGFTVQAGMDVALGTSGRWYANVDAKYMKVEPDIKYDLFDRGFAGASLLGKNVKLSPWLLSVGIGYRF
ncbi:hypothetical protein C1T17_20650 (plasmid) [Sphingobium sp. SCG-1]|uniref:OmpW/AlkL family protein n=1 Tax=Sphingobium sp. SCG-1 TaxID=2072936 RepID=UPI000CD68EE3|nr:OmpW family outer membrane protein [Sphingobium sp. SCG-1]AUW60618.1 hypothetical protein C1T17_20650 [Sphingobium sp. SCG-1]